MALIHITPDIVSLEGGRGRGRGGGMKGDVLEEKRGEGCLRGVKVKDCYRLKKKDGGKEYKNSKESVCRLCIASSLNISIHLWKV